MNGDYGHALEVTRQNPQSDWFFAHIEYTPIYGQLGMKQEALDIWHKLQAEVPGASADTFANWWRLWNFSNGEVAKLMNGVYKSGVLGAEGGAPGPLARAARPCSSHWVSVLTH